MHVFADSLTGKALEWLWNSIVNSVSRYRTHLLGSLESRLCENSDRGKIRFSHLRASALRKAGSAVGVGSDDLRPVSVTHRIDRGERHRDLPRFRRLLRVKHRLVSKAES